MAKKRITKAELEQRDALGEKIVYICQEQIDILIHAIGEIAQFFLSNKTMEQKDLGRILNDKLPKFEKLTEKKRNLLASYIKDKEEKNGKLDKQ